MSPSEDTRTEEVPTPAAPSASTQFPYPVTPANVAGARPAQPAVPAEPAVQQRAGAALLIALLSLCGLLSLNELQRGAYLAGFALLAGTTGIWMAVTAIRRSRRGGTALPKGSVTAVVIGGVGVTLSGILLLGFALLGRQISTFSQCLGSANTVAAQQTCQQQFISSVGR